MKYQAISILSPAVENILTGSKSIEIRSWRPEKIPLNNVVLVQNKKYLKKQSDEDNGIALAIVDFVSIRDWSYEEYLKQNDETTLNKSWAKGYFIWVIENIRPIKKPVVCKAKRGIYLLDIDIKY